MTEHNIKQFDVPEESTYADYPIEEIGYNIDLERVYVLYERRDLPEDWDQLIFSAKKDGDSITITDFPAGLVPPESLYRDSPGGREADELYALLEEIGIEVEGYEN